MFIKPHEGKVCWTCVTCAFGFGLGWGALIMILISEISGHIK